MDIKDLTGLSEPLKRLIEVLSAGVGKVFAPYLIRKNADAKAYEIRTISAAMNDVALNRPLPVVYKDGSLEIWQKPDDYTLQLQKNDFEDRYKERLDFQQRRQQYNIEIITRRAAEDLNKENTVPLDKPDADWISRFFNYAQDIGSLEMQDLWGRILSGEIKKPGKYSLRTLDTVRNLSKMDAELFGTFAKYALNSNNIWVIILGNKEKLSSQFKIYPSQQFYLSELGLIYPTDLSLKLFHNENEEVLLSTEKSIFVINQSQPIHMFQVPIWKFTQIGQELISLIDKPFNAEYYQFVSNVLKQHNCEGKIGPIKNILPDGRVEFDTQIEFKK